MLRKHEDDKARILAEFKLQRQQLARKEEARLVKELE
jgi:hypothetical protein